MVATTAPSESPSWVTVTPGGPADADAQPKEQPSTWEGVWVELYRLLGLSTLPTDGATQAAYRHFHASAWLPRLRCLLLALGLLSIAELASELSTAGSTDASLHARLRSLRPAEGRAGLALAVLLRCCAVGVTTAATFTRWPPLQGLLTRR